MNRALLLCTCLSLQSQAFAALLAEVDQAQITAQDTLELTLENTGATQFGKPDLTALSANFEILSTRQVNQLNNLAGTAKTHSKWLITLKPLRTGSLTIPALVMGDSRSQPIEISVSAAQQDSSVSEPLSIEAVLDQPSVYVQAQALLTVRVYHSVSLYDDSQLSTPEIANTRVEALGAPRTYEKTINNVLHGVIEASYALYPQQSGPLTIQGLSFSATPVERVNGVNRPGPLTTLHAPPLSLEVKPKPASYPPDQPWLPARAISLSQTLSPDTSQVYVGESLVREVKIQAQGLPAAALTQAPVKLTGALRRYPEQPLLTDQSSAQGLTGTRIDREVWVATRAENATLAPMQLVWWNVTTDQLETLSLPEQRLVISQDPQFSPNTLPDYPEQAMTMGPKLWPWQLLSALLALGNGLWMWLWWRARRQPAVSRSISQGPSPRTLQDDVRRACASNDPAAARQALDAWARQYPETLAQMSARYEPLSLALDELNGALYAQTAQHWDADSLWNAVRTLPPLDVETANTQESASLPPLYPR